MASRRALFREVVEMRYLWKNGGKGPKPWSGPRRTRRSTRRHAAPPGLSLAARRRVVRDAAAPCDESQPEERKSRQRRHSAEPRANARHVAASQRGGDGEVYHAPQRHDVDQKLPEPAGVDVERVLRRLDTAIGDGVHDLQALDRPER